MDKPLLDLLKQDLRSRGFAIADKHGAYNVRIFGSVARNDPPQSIRRGAGVCALKMYRATGYLSPVSGGNATDCRAQTHSPRGMASLSYLEHYTTGSSAAQNRNYSAPEKQPASQISSR
jgi:hypothetical protein